MYFSGMEIQWLTQQISSICTPEPRFNLSAPKTTVSRNLTGLGLGFLFSFSNQVPSLLIFTLCLYWKYFFFLKKLFIVYFASVFAEQLATDLWCSNSFSVLSSWKELLWHSRFQWTSSVATPSDQSVTSGWATAVIQPISPAEGALRLHLMGLFTLWTRICAYNEPL